MPLHNYMQHNFEDKRGYATMKDYLLFTDPERRYYANKASNPNHNSFNKKQKFS